MKKKFAILSLFVFFLLMFSSCEKDEKHEDYMKPPPDPERPMAHNNLAANSFFVC